MSYSTSNLFGKTPKGILFRVQTQARYFFQLMREFPILGRSTKIKVVGVCIPLVIFFILLVTAVIKSNQRAPLLSPISSLPNSEVAVTHLAEGEQTSPFQKMVGRVLGFKALKSSASWRTNWNGEDMKELLERAKDEKTNVVVTIKLFENTPIEQFLACGKCREKTINQTLKEIQEKGASGVNVDFEYFGTPPKDTVIKYAQFMRDLTDVIHKEVESSTVSMAVYATSAREERIHNVELVGSFIDYVFIMGYDFFRPSSTNAGPIAPLFGVEKYGYDLQTSVEDFLAKIPAEKIVLGVPYYGYDWPVEGQGVNAKVLPYNDQNGGIGVVYFDKALEQEKNNSLLLGWDRFGSVPYYSYYDIEKKVWRQVYYENERSLREKYDFIRSKKIRGVGLWALGFDGRKVYSTVILTGV